MQRRILLLITAVLVSACVPACGFDTSVPPTQRNAVLFSWDGVPREHLLECLSRNELPNLAALIKEGSIVNIDIDSHQTATKPGHVQMLTGYDPDVTGTRSNPQFKAISEGLSIFERLEKAFGDDKITTIMLTGALHHIGACPPSTAEQRKEAQAKLDKADAATDPAERESWQATVWRANGEPFYNVSKNIDIWDGEARRPSSVHGPTMLKYLDQYGKGRFFMFCHFLEPDHAGHAHGESSKQYNDGIINCDQWLGKAVKKLKELGVYDRTMVFVTSDHGFDRGKKSHNDAPRVFLAENAKSLVRNGNQRDLTPTILTEMGVDISELRPAYKGAILTKQ